MSLFRTLFPTARRLLVERSLRALDLSASRRVLVVGAGTDPYRDLFPSAERYVRSDIAPTPGTTDLLADAHALPCADGSFDCLLASEVLEHLADAPRFAAEAHRVLAPGGCLVLTVPFLFHRHGHPHDFARYTPDGLRVLLRDFPSVEITPQGDRLHVLSDLLTTAFSPRPVLFPLRALNPVLASWPGRTSTTAPSGHLVMARR